MKLALNKISNTVSGLFATLFGASAKQIDNNSRRLVQYIIALNKKKNPNEIINEASLCLKDIVNYRLFAFAIKRENGIDVWLDPRMYKLSLESIIVNDFALKDKTGIKYLNHSFDDYEQEKKFTMKNLVSYDLLEEDCHAKIYMVPGRTMLICHDDMVSVILKSTGIALSRQMNIARLADAASLDPLTGCYNRREFKTQINRNIASAMRHKTPLSVFMLDIDYFKKVNDTYGHQAGDQVLKSITSLVKKNIRTDDILARYGGEEFMVILPRTGKREAMELADRIRFKIEKTPIKTTENSIYITASFGVASLKGNGNATELIKAADTMLYKAKLNGRNTVMPGLIKICSQESQLYQSIPKTSVQS